MDPATDLAVMRQAIEIAEGARGDVSPRPWVGAVVEPGGFRGATDGREGPHAEVVALRNAGEEARGATLYCTLEPCSHHGKTPPCADAIVEAGVGRVVVGLEDPDPQVRGRGIARLREAGVEVEVGVAETEVRRQLAPYLKHRATGLPYVVLKLAASLDGRTAAPDGTSQWITGEQARADAHELRAESDAILVGAGTVRADDPSLTVRLADSEDIRQPLRVVLGEAPPEAKVQPALQVSGDLEEILDDLGHRDVLQLLVEGGPTVAGEFHRRGLVDRYVFYLAPALFGGDDARPLLAGPGASTIDELWRGEVALVTRLGRDVRIDVTPLRPPPPDVGGST